MTTDKLETRKSLSPQVKAQNGIDLIIPTWSTLMVPKSQSFNEVFDHHVERNHDENHGSEDNRKSSQNGSGETEGLDTGDNKVAGDKLRQSLSRQAKQSGTKMAGKGQNADAVQAGVSQVLRSTRAGAEGTSLSANDSGGQKTSGTALPLNALGAERTMQEIEQMVQSKNQNPLPPELMDQLVAFISTFRSEEKKRLTATIRQNALGGDLRIHLEKMAGQPGTHIGFEGDPQVLAYLQAHQEELSGALDSRGFVHEISFGA